MAPKKRQTRMDAAYDHLRPLGFSKSLIRSKVNSLLKVYGDEGWVFFEDDAYKLLIEVILEEQDKHSLKSSSMEDRAVEAASTSNQQPNQVAETDHTCTESESEPGLELDKKPDFLGLPLPAVLFQEPVATPPCRKRKPCYGWISSDDEEDIVFLETEFSLLRKNCRSECRKERKNRWDVKPEEM